MFSPGQEHARQTLNGPARCVCLVGGTRSGKTFLIVRNIVVRALKSPMSRHALLRFRANAARSSLAMDTIPNVMRVCFPGVGIREHRQDGYFELPNKSQLWLGGLDAKDRVEKILGTEFATLFVNEASQINYGTFNVAITRLAQVATNIRQKCYVDLNPTGKLHWTNRLFGDKVDPTTGQPLSNPHMYDRAFLNPRDNAHVLSSDYIESLEALPERARRRFYEGQYVDELDGALWTLDVLESTRVELGMIPEQFRKRVVVAVDPSGTSGDEEKRSDEVGIVAACRDTDDEAYVLEDLSIQAGPTEWATRAVNAFFRLKADCIVAESNYGGEMVRSTIHSVNANVPVKLVSASRGKAVRAEPISTLFAQGKAHMVGRMSKLEDQMCAFSVTGYTGTKSPDRADAMVWALTELMLGANSPEPMTGSYAVVR